MIIAFIELGQDESTPHEFNGDNMLAQMELMCFSATKNTAAAKDFYSNILGLTLVEDSPFALAFDCNGTMLRVQKVPDHVPPKHTSLGWNVTDIAKAVQELVNKGIRFERYPGMAQDDIGVWNSPSVASVAWFLEPDGNTLSLTQWPA